MTKITSKWQSWSSYLLSILRIVAAITFLTYGSMKLMNWPAVMPEEGAVATFNLIWWAGILEFFGGILLTIGLFSRTTAFILSGEMAFAYFMGHAAQALWPVANGGTPAVLFCFLWLFISSAGAGPLSVDGFLRRRRTQETPAM